MQSAAAERRGGEGRGCARCANLGNARGNVRRRARGPRDLQGAAASRGGRTGKGGEGERVKHRKDVTGRRRWGEGGWREREKSTREKEQVLRYLAGGVGGGVGRAEGDEASSAACIVDVGARPPARPPAPLLPLPRSHTRRRECATGWRFASGTVRVKCAEALHKVKLQKRD
jgi:hypothetical protein